MDYRLDVGKMNMAVILLNLYKCFYLDPDKWIAYSRRTGNYKSIFRYNRHKVSYRPIVRIVEYLEREKFIDTKLGFRDKVTKVTRLSRMKARSKLAELFRSYNFTSNLITGPRYNDVVVLKGVDGKEKPYVDSTRNGAAKKRKIIQEYNGLLKRTYIDLDIEGYVPKKCIHVDMSRKHIYRIFSNGRWDMPQKPDIKYGGNRAYYSVNLDYIQLPHQHTFDTIEEYYNTCFHELSHATGHANRLGRKSILEPSYFGSHEYSKEELVAEMGAAFLCGFSGIVQQTIENSAAYIGGWLKALKNDKTLLIHAAAAGQKASDYIGPDYLIYTQSQLSRVQPVLRPFFLQQHQSSWRKG